MVTIAAMGPAAVRGPKVAVVIVLVVGSADSRRGLVVVVSLGWGSKGSGSKPSLLCQWPWPAEPKSPEFCSQSHPVSNGLLVSRTAWAGTSIASVREIM